MGDVLTRHSAGYLDAFHRGLIVSCQAEHGDPFNAPELIARFALAAAMGGAAAIRARGPENVRAIRDAVSLPIIGLAKGMYPDGRVLITPDLADVEALIVAGAELIAADATNRRRPNGLTGGEFIAAIRERWTVPIVADVSTLKEGADAFHAGAAFTATTLSGYTEATERRNLREPDWRLLKGLVQLAAGPVILEARVSTPAQSRRGLDLGAHAVVVGTAISRPRLITRSFVDAMS